MIDLNYLYTYSTYRAKDRAPTAYEYLTDSALIKQSRQNFGKYYEGVITERIQDVASEPETPLNALDLFIIALNEMGYTVEDFLTACKSALTPNINEVDTYFYHIMPDNRIFSALNELRARGNTAFSGFAQRPDEVKPFREICTTDFLFGEPVRSGIAKSMLDGLAKMYHQAIDSKDKTLKFEPSAKEMMTLLSMFYLDNKDGKFVFSDSENTPENIRKNPKQFLKNIGKAVSSDFDIIDPDDEELIISRNEIYEDLIDFSDFMECWGHYENYLTGIQFIKSSGEPSFTKSKSAEMRPAFEACSNRACRRSVVAQPLQKFDSNWEDIDDFMITKEQCDNFRDRIVGQRSAVNEIVDKLAGVSCGFYVKNHPIASFLMNGPTGVGKTETAKALADTFFGGRLFTVDMSTFKHPSDVARLIGSPPGFVGYEDTIALLDFIENSPNGVINFDEIDKCDRGCLSFLLSILDEGKFASAKGKEYDVQNFVVTCTTNQKAQTSRKSANFNLDELMSRTGEDGTPFVKEFLGRFDSILEYENLTKEELKGVLSKKLDSKITAFTQNKPDTQISLTYGDQLLEDILIDCNYTATGARALNSSIQKLFVRPISHYLIDSASEESGEEFERKIVVAGNNQLVVNGETIELDLPKNYAPVESKKESCAEQQYIG